MTKLVDRLERAGLLRRESCPEDRRGSYAVLTAEGEEMLRELWRVYSRVLRESVVEQLTGEEAKLLAEALNRLSAGGSRAQVPAASTG